MELVSVVVSIYHPNMNFLEKQIRSLDEQSYDNIEIIIWDDDPDSAFDKKFFEKLIKKHKYYYLKGKENIGYAKAFAHLTEIAKGQYIAYCDQDDIWLCDKIKKCVKALEEEKGVLVTADRAIIDENDTVLISSNREQQKDIANSWSTGEHITPEAVFTTCAIGMNIVMRTDIAQELLPIPENVAHDRWLVAGASVKGKLIFLDEVLVQYRRHTQNVSGIMRGIYNKRDYLKKRVEKSYMLAKEFINRFPELSKEDKKIISEFSEARYKQNIFQMLKYRKISPDVIKFEIFLSVTPDFLVKKAIAIMKKRIKN